MIAVSKHRDIQRSTSSLQDLTSLSIKQFVQLLERNKVARNRLQKALTMYDTSSAEGLDILLSIIQSIVSLYE